MASTALFRIFTRKYIDRVKACPTSKVKSTHLPGIPPFVRYYYVIRVSFSFSWTAFTNTFLLVHFHIQHSHFWRKLTFQPTRRGGGGSSYQKQGEQLGCSPLAAGSPSRYVLLRIHQVWAWLWLLSLLQLFPPTLEQSRHLGHLWMKTCAATTRKCYAQGKCCPPTSIIYPACVSANRDIIGLQQRHASNTSFTSKVIKRLVTQSLCLCLKKLEKRGKKENRKRTQLVLACS